MTHSLSMLALVAFVAWSVSPAAAAGLLDPGNQTGDLSRGVPLLLADSHATDHTDHADVDATSGIGQGTGVIRSVDGEGRSLTIDHGPIDEVGMGAMTMGFGVTGAVDLSGLAEGDTVAFRIKRGRDNSYRVTAICNTGTDGSDCLEAGTDPEGN